MSLSNDPVENLIDSVQHELHKHRRIAPIGADSDGIIILVLKALNLAFDGDILKQRVPLGKQCRLPKPRNATVAVTIVDTSQILSSSTSMASLRSVKSSSGECIKPRLM